MSPSGPPLRPLPPLPRSRSFWPSLTPEGMVTSRVRPPAASSRFEVQPGAAVRVFQADAHGGFVVAAVHGHGPAPRAAMAAPQRVQQVGQVDVLERPGPAAELARPLRRRRELLARGPAAEFVVGRALFRVLQGLVGLAHFLESGLGLGRLGHIGVVLSRQLAVGLLDLLGIGIARHAEGRVVVFVLHGARAIEAPCQCTRTSKRRFRPSRSVMRMWRLSTSSRRCCWKAEKVRLTVSSFMPR